MHGYKHNFVICISIFFHSSHWQFLQHTWQLGGLPAFFSIRKIGHQTASHWKSTLLKNNSHSTLKTCQQFFNILRKKTRHHGNYTSMGKEICNSLVAPSAIQIHIPAILIILYQKRPNRNIIACLKCWFNITVTWAALSNYLFELTCDRIVTVLDKQSFCLTSLTQPNSSQACWKTVYCSNTLSVS